MTPLAHTGNDLNPHPSFCHLMMMIELRNITQKVMKLWTVTKMVAVGVLGRKDG